VNERRRITAETALRLARYFKTNAEFWLNLQNFYDLECERRARKLKEIERQVQLDLRRLRATRLELFSFCSRPVCRR